MKVLIGSLQQESNSLPARMSTEADFDRLRGADILPLLTPATEVFAKEGVEVIPLTFAHAVPGGTLKEESFRILLKELTDAIPDGGFDGVWLYLHGALNVENIGSGDTAILRAFREKVGAGVPIAVAMDFHANLPTDVVDYANLICGYKTAPHSDMEATQAKAARGLVRMMREKLLPTPAIVKIPMMLSGDMVLTAEEPMRSVMMRAAAMATEPDVLDACVFPGQSWVDAPHSGACTVVTATSREKAAAYAHELAQRFWDVRGDFRFRIPAGEIEQLLPILAAAEAPAFITDSGDNTTAGADGDRTDMLRALMASGLEKVLVAGITDAPFVAAFSGKPAGTELTLSLGGTLSDPAQRITVTATLLKNQHILNWDGLDGGECVVVRIGNVDVIVTASRCSVISPAIIASSGAVFEDYHIIAVKLGYLYPDLAAAAKVATIAFTMGTSCVAIEKIPFRHIPRPMYPMDADAVFM